MWNGMDFEFAKGEFPLGYIMELFMTLRIT
jgi:hypothetical protein